MRKSVAYVWGEVSIDWSEIVHNSLNFAETTNSPGPVNARVKINRRNRDNDDVYFETLRLEIWQACIKTLLCFMKSVDYAYNTYFLIF